MKGKLSESLKIGIEWYTNTSLFLKKIYRNTFLIVLSKYKLKSIIVMINSTNIKEYKAVIVIAPHNCKGQEGKFDSWYLFPIYKELMSWNSKP